jgi:hypothetical protein
LEHAQIAIFDALGRQVMSVQTAQLHPGVQSLALPVRLARGMHFVSVQTRDAVRTITLSVDR